MIKTRRNTFLVKPRKQIEDNNGVYLGEVNEEILNRGVIIQDSSIQYKGDALCEYVSKGTKVTFMKNKIIMLNEDVGLLNLEDILTYGDEYGDEVRGE